MQTIQSVENQYRSGSPRSRELFERVRPLMAGAAKGAYYYSPYPLSMQRGEGCHLYDVDGRCFVDFAGHHTSQILGHNHPAVLGAVQAQMEQGIALGAPTGREDELAAEMCRRVPSLQRVRFTNSGTEATLHAIRLARGFTGKTRIAKFEGGYHGSHDVVEVSVAPSLQEAGPEAEPYSVATAGGISPHAAAEVVVLPYDDEAAVDRLIQRHRDELACVVLDPRTGILPQRPEFLHSVEKSARQAGVLLILDEIVSFRVGPAGLQGELGLEPDLTTFGKIIGGGFPVGGFGGRADIMDLFDNSRGATGFFQSGSFSAHPISMTAGLAVLRELTSDAFAHINQLTARASAALQDCLREKKVPAQVVAEGSLFSIHFTRAPVVNYRGLAQTDKAVTHRLFLALINRGFFMAPFLSDNAISLPMQESHINGLVDAFEGALEEVLPTG